MTSIFIHAMQIVTILAAALLSAGAYGAPDERPIDLSGEWHIIDADIPDAAKPEFNDTKTGTIMIPGDWPALVKKNPDQAATVWLRKKIIIRKADNSRNLILSLGTIAVADETFFNGVYIGGRGKFPSESGRLDYWFAWQSSRNYSIPATLVRWDGENVIAIRVFSHIINGMSERPQLIPGAQWEDYELVKEYMPAAYKIISILVMGLLLLFFVLIMKSSIRTSLVLSGIALMLAVSALNVLVLGFPKMLPGLARYKFMLGCYTLADFFLLMFVREFFEIRHRAGLIISACLLLAAEAAIAVAPDTAAFTAYSAAIALSVVVCFILYTAALFLIALFRDPRRYWYLVLPFGIILLSASDKLIDLLMYRFSVISLSSLYHVPLFFLAGMFVKIFDLKNAQRERDSLTRIVLQKTNRINRLMSQAKKADNVRPEPREAILGLVEYLDTNYTETYERIALAKKFNLNEDYMGQVFKKYTGTTISNYINQKRIEAAKELLQETENKIIDIAFHVGFDNLTYFNRIFKKLTGYTPREYRKAFGSALFSNDDMTADEEIY